nr:hypothetical protein [Tanacetum cinerariifolium]
VLDHFPEYFEHVTLYKFKHARALVESRACHSRSSESMWESWGSGGVGLEWREMGEIVLAGKSVEVLQCQLFKRGRDDFQGLVCCWELMGKVVGIMWSSSGVVRSRGDRGLKCSKYTANGDVVKPKVAAAEHISQFNEPAPRL